MKTRTITIPKSEIYFDVDAATHVFATAAEAGGLKRSDALESDTGDAMRQMMVTRFADRRVAELEERLSQFLTTANPEVPTATVAIGSQESYSFSLYVEAAFQDELLKPLASAMESYIAHGVIADWYTDAGDAHAASYLQSLSGDLVRIENYIVSRKSPARS